MLRDPDERGGPVSVRVHAIRLAQRSRSEPMSLEKVGDDLERPRAVLDSRRPDALVVAVEGEHLRLVDRGPEIDQIAVALARETREAHEVRDVSDPLPSAECREPAGIGEVVQRNHRGDAARPAGEEDTAVVVEGPLVVPTRLRLDSAPLDREAVGIEPEGAQDVEVLLVALPAEARCAGAISVPDLPRDLLPIPPVVPVVPPLDLMRGCAGSPEKDAGRHRGGSPSATPTNRDASAWACTLISGTAVVSQYIPLSGGPSV